MARKCIKISSGAGLVIFISGLVVLSISPRPYRPQQGKSETINLTFSNPEIQCRLSYMSDGCIPFDDYTPEIMNTPSLESFIRASTAMKNQQLRLSGLAVFLNLTDACQPLADVSKAKIQVNKIALIRLENEAVCPLQGLVEHAQNAGYSVVIVWNYCYSLRLDNNTQLQNKLLIPVLYEPFCLYSINHSYVNFHDVDVFGADSTNIYSDK